MSSSLDNISLNFEDRVTLNAPSNSTLEFIGNLGADVNVSNANDIIVAGEFDTGTTMGGHAVMIYGERNTNVTTGGTIAMGNGASSTAAAPYMPQAGRVVAITIRTASASTGTFAVTVNSVNSALTVSLAGGTSAVATGTIVFAAGDRIIATASSGTLVRPKVAIFLVFD